MSRGQYDRMVTFQRATVVTDPESGQESSTWATLEQGWAKVRFGTGQEKREAAMESGSQSASFELVPTQKLNTVSLKDRIQFDGSDWDITEVAPLDRNNMRFTATRSR